MGRRGGLVCFMGIDGSGKSTLARLLAAALREDGVDSRYVYGGINPLLSRPFIYLAQSLFMGRRDIFRDYGGYVQRKRRLMGNGLLSWAYLYLVLLDHTLQLLFKVGLPRLLGRCVVCDRYIYDTILTHMASDMVFSDARLRRALRLCRGLLPRPDLVFVPDVPEEVAFQRKADVPSLDYLRQRRGLYLEAARELKAIVLDGCRSLEELVAVARHEARLSLWPDRAIAEG